MNKCDGIKILELDPKRNLEGNEYMVVAEKDQNYKAPINQIELKTIQMLLQNLQQGISRMKLTKVYQNLLIR